MSISSGLKSSAISNMFFSKTALSVLAFVSSLVAAFPANNGCGNTGDLQCCNSMQSSSNTAVTDLFNLLGEGPTLAGSTAQVGLSCSPIISDTGLGGATTCSQQTACCSESRFNGLVAVGCMPMTLPAAA
ncbi:hypothetical protein HGRIS_013691 [Hohenbuehelia grisea]|uniref:Hydrophobin n=1 Tax=Hohenbuehelia grisea TaxID=104357 RepID=A0ABR3IWC6_9AGAR